MPQWITLLVYAVLTVGATVRLTRLIGYDAIAGPFRAWLILTFKNPRISELMRCPYCLGFWIALLVTAVAWPLAGFPTTPAGLIVAAAAVLTTNHLAALVYQLGD